MRQEAKRVGEALRVLAAARARLARQGGLSSDELMNLTKETAMADTRTDDLSAAEMARMWQKDCERAGLPTTTIPYALRHSSIVRGLRLGLPTRLAAAIHDRSIAMIERHYSRCITEGPDELAARAVVPLIASAV